MIEINSTHANHSVCSCLIQTQLEIQQCPEWHGVLSEAEAEERLRLQPPQTYLLREADQHGKFYLSFVQSDLTIVHQYFLMDSTKKEWFYKNGDPHHIPSLPLLIQQIMHCPSHECLPLKKP